MLNEESALTIKDTPSDQETTSTPEQSLLSGIEEHRAGILATYDKIGKFSNEELKVTVIESGFHSLDQQNFLTEKEGRLITIGAHTSHGKTALLMQLATHVSKTRPVIIHSFEMSQKKLETRILSSVTGIPSGMIKNGSALHSKVEEARADFRSRHLYLSNIRNSSLSFVMSSIYEMAKIVGQPGLVVIDYAQQVRPGASKNAQRVNEITDISAGLLQLAMQLNCNVLVGAQLNNEILKRAWHTQDDDGNMQYIPRIDDIREGSSIAHDSDTVLMVVRPGKFDRSKPDVTGNFYAIKTRDGEEWETTMEWDGTRCMFKEKENYPL